MAGILGFKWYNDFKENLGPRWAYYLFPMLDRADWNEVRDAVWPTACLLRDGSWKHARWLSRLIALGATLDVAVALQPDTEAIIESYLGSGSLEVHFRNSYPGGGATP
jgi:hypothetical protein